MGSLSYCILTVWSFCIYNITVCMFENTFNTRFVIKLINSGMARCDTRAESGVSYNPVVPLVASYLWIVSSSAIPSTIATFTEEHNHPMCCSEVTQSLLSNGVDRRGSWEQSRSTTVDRNGSDWSLTIVDFSHRNQTGCLKDPHQQSTKPRKMKNMNHKVSKTPKIIRIGSLSMILGPFEHHHRSYPNY